MRARSIAAGALALALCVGGTVGCGESEQDRAAREAAQRAQEAAEEAGREASKAAQEAARAVQEQAREAAEAARDAAARATESAEDAARRMREEAGQEQPADPATPPPAERPAGQ